MSMSKMELEDQIHRLRQRIKARESHRHTLQSSAEWMLQTAETFIRAVELIAEGTSGPTVKPDLTVAKADHLPDAGNKVKEDPPSPAS